MEVDQQIREVEVVVAEDEEVAAVQEQIHKVQAEEEEFETFDLKIVHHKNRSGLHFEWSEYVENILIPMHMVCGSSVL